MYKMEESVEQMYMTSLLVQILLPTGKVAAFTIARQSTLKGLTERFLSECRSELIEEVCGKEAGEEVKDTTKWGIQRWCEATTEKNRFEGTLACNDQAFLPMSMSIEEALRATTELEGNNLRGKAEPYPGDEIAIGKREDVMNVRLLYLPNEVTVVFRDVVGIPQDLRRSVWIWAEARTSEVLDAIMDQMGLRKTVMIGVRTAAFNYMLQLESESDQDTESIIPLSARLLSHLKNVTPNRPNPPFSIVFTTSNDGKECTGVFSDVKDSNSPPVLEGSEDNQCDKLGQPDHDQDLDNIGSDEEDEGLFPAEWNDPEPDAQLGHTQSTSEDSTGSGETLKRRTQNLSTPKSTRARLSRIFSNWITPESTGTTPKPSGKERDRRHVVSGPLAILDSDDITMKFQTWSGAELSAISHALNEEHGSSPLPSPTLRSLDSSFELFMDDLAIKQAQRDVMRNLSTDRKSLLLNQHSYTISTPSPLRVSKTGPITSLETITYTVRKDKEMSDTEDLSLSSPLTAVATEFPGHNSPTSRQPQADSTVALPTENIKQEITGGKNVISESSNSWSSWWAIASTITGVSTSNTEHSTDSPAFYVDHIKSKKIRKLSLVKHLIALRVRLSTSQLAWTEQFLGLKGLDAFEELFARTVLHKEQSSLNDEDDAVRTETIKCLRVLLNTEIGFEKVLAHSNLVTYVSFCLFSTSNKLRAQVADVLAALCVLSLQDGHRLVLAALSEFKVAHKEKFRFEYLVSSIGADIEQESGELDDYAIWEFRTAAMSLINSIINGPQELSERVALREEFLRRGLSTVIDSLRASDPPEHLLVQLELFTELRQEDTNEGLERLSEPVDIRLMTLLKGVQGYPDLYHLLLAINQDIKSMFERTNVDGAYRLAVSTILKNFAQAVSRMENFKSGWTSNIQDFLASIEDIVGESPELQPSVTASGSSIPTESREELEKMKARIIELEREVASAQAKPVPRATIPQSEDRELPRILSSEYKGAIGYHISPKHVQDVRTLRAEADIERSTVENQYSSGKIDLRIKTPIESVDEDDLAARAYKMDRRQRSQYDNCIIDNLLANSMNKATSGSHLPLSPDRRNSRTIPIPTTTKAENFPPPPNAPPPPPPPPPPPKLPPMHESPISSDACSKTSGQPLKGTLRQARDTHRNDNVAKSHPTSAWSTLPVATTFQEASNPSFVLPPSAPPAPPPPPLASDALRIRCSNVPMVPNTAMDKLTVPRVVSTITSLQSISNQRIVKDQLAMWNQLSQPPRKKLKPLFWKKIPAGDPAQSVWNSVKGLEPLDLFGLDENFEVETTAPKRTAVSNPQATNKYQTVLTLTRATNVSIMLARIRLSSPIIRDAIQNLDDEVLTVDNLKAIRHSLPTSDEMDALSGFNGDHSSLNLADQYFLKIMETPRLSQRLACMITRRRLDMDMEELKPELSILRHAADELRNSVFFKQIMSTVLAMGNRLNANSFRGNASGFQIESLLKLEDTRATRSSTSTPTLLHYLVRVLSRHDPTLCHFLTTTPHVEAAARISVKSVMGSVQTLITSVSQVQEELVFMSNSGIDRRRDPFVIAMESFCQEALPAIDALRVMRTQLEIDLRSLVQYFCEDPNVTKPEDVFGIVVKFSYSLLRAEKEIGSRSPSDISLSKSNNVTTLGDKNTKQSKLVAPGGLDNAIRDLRRGRTTRAPIQDDIRHGSSSPGPP